MGKTAIFGGTFNPPQLAHRKMLETVADMKDVSRVIVIPNNIPPHKTMDSRSADGADRLYMCRIMCGGIKKAVVSDIELKCEGKSYTVYTIEKLKKRYKDLWLLIGGDMVASFTSWYSYEKILQTAGIIAVRRPDVSDTDFDAAVKDLESKGGRITVTDAKMPQISSTEIRNLIRSGQSADGFLQPEVARFIKEKGLYL